MKQLFVAFLAVLSFLIVLDKPTRANHLYPQLELCVNPSLQGKLEESLSSLQLKDYAQNKKLCVALVDVTDAADPQVAMVNGTHMMYAASLPKIAILLGAFEQIDNGAIPANPATYDSLIKMIRKSSNLEATNVLNRIGMDYLSELLQSPRYRLYDKDKNGGLWVGKEYGKNPARKRDPLHNISHGATALQVARFFYLLETGRLVSPEHSQEMKTILGNPAINHKFVKGLKRYRPDSRIYRKSGTWRDYHSDGALIEHNGRKYIAVGLAQNPRGGEWLSRLIVALDDIITGSPS